MVDDGSTDGSARDRRARSPRATRASGSSRQPNGGLSKARNTGIDAADGRVPRVRRQRRHAAAATPTSCCSARSTRPARTSPRGNVYRLTSVGDRPARVPREGVRRDAAEDAHHAVPPAARRPHGLEQAVAALVLGPARAPLPRGRGARGHPGRRCRRTSPARSVDVIAEPVYLYRIREGGRPVDHAAAARAARAARPRSTAVEQVSGYLAARDRREAKRWYDAERRRRGPALLPQRARQRRRRATAQLFLDRVNAFLDERDRHVFDAAAGDRAAQVAPRPAPADARAARGPALPARATCATRRPCGSARSWYGDYPFRTDARARRSRASVYRLDKELGATPHVDDLRWDGRARSRLEG